jgi:hypothetical protein
MSREFLKEMFGSYEGLKEMEIEGILCPGHRRKNRRYYFEVWRLL